MDMTARIVCDLGSEKNPKVPNRVLIAPWGRVERADGDSFTIDDESATRVVSKFNALKRDVVIDFEHQTLGGKHSAPNGRAPAAGWVTALEVRPGFGIVANVNWTRQASEHLASREFRYLSPVFNTLHGVGGRMVDELHSVGLTNTPAIVGANPIVNSLSMAEIDAARDERKLEADRRSMIDSSGRAWDAQKDLQKICGRAAYINAHITECGYRGLSTEEAEQVSGTGGQLREPSDAGMVSNKAGASDPRGILLGELSREFDSSRELQKMCSSKRAYVNGGLLAENFARLTDEEALTL